MIREGYFIVRFNEIGTSILSVKINNLFERLMFINRENALKYFDRFNTNHDLYLHHAVAYIDNKILYENDTNMIDHIDADNLMVV